MSILTLPPELLLEIFSYQDDRITALKNVRRAVRGLDLFCASQLFQTIVLNLDDTKCIQFLLRFDSSKDTQNESRSGSTSSVTKMLIRSFETVSWYATEINITYKNLVSDSTDFEDNKSTSRQDQEQALSALSQKGIRSLLIACPALQIINATLVDSVLSDISWINFLTSICPQHEYGGGTKWSLNLNIDAPPIGSTKHAFDEYSNINKLYNLTSFKLGSHNSQPKNRTRFVKALAQDLSSLIDHSSNLTYLGLHAGVGWNFSMDAVLTSHISRTTPLQLRELALENVLSPQKSESINILGHLKSFAFADRHFNKVSDHPYHKQNTRIGKKGEIKSDCTWQLFSQFEIWLSSLKSRTPCIGLMSYLEEARFPGKLTSVELSGPFNSLTDQPDVLAHHFWFAILPHTQALTSLKIEPSHYGDWCWKPASYTASTTSLAAKEAISKMGNLKSLTICPADTTRIVSGNVQKHPFVRELLESTCTLPKLERVELLLSVPQWIISPICGPALRHQRIMSRFYKQAVEVSPHKRPGLQVIVRDVEYK